MTNEKIDYNKKIENLHNKLSKYERKIKNQKNEITLLIQQKEELKSKHKYLEDYKRIFKSAMSEVSELQEKLNIANKTVKLQIDEISRLNKICDDRLNSHNRITQFNVNHYKKSIDILNDSHERQMKVSENEIKRLSVIVNYLEDRLNERA